MSTGPGPRRLRRSPRRWDEGGLLPLAGSQTSEPVPRGGADLPSQERPDAEASPRPATGRAGPAHRRLRGMTHQVQARRTC